MALGEGFEFFNKKEQICCEELPECYRRVKALPGFRK